MKPAHSARPSARVRMLTTMERLEPRLHLSVTAGAIIPNGGAAQRSAAVTVGGSFAGGNVHASLGAGDLLLWNRTTHTFVDTSDASVIYNDTRNSATWFLSSALPDGDYRTTLKSMDVYAANGEPLDGDTNGVGGDDAYSSFHVF